MAACRGLAGACADTGRTGGACVIAGMVRRSHGGAASVQSLLRGYEMADALRDEVAFDLFFALAAPRLSPTAMTADRCGTADPAQQRQAMLRDAASNGGRIWARIGEIHRETDRHNLDRRQAVVTALGLLAMNESVPARFSYET